MFYLFKNTTFLSSEDLFWRCVLIKHHKAITQLLKVQITIAERAQYL